MRFRPALHRETSPRSLRSYPSRRGPPSVHGKRLDVFRGTTKPPFSHKIVSTRTAPFSKWNPSPAMSVTGLEHAYIQNRDALVRFLRVRGAGESAEDIVNDLWIRVSERTDQHIANPLAYLYRAADMMMIDRYRSHRQAALREQAWEDDRQSLGSMTPGPEREVSARQAIARADATLRSLGDRKAAIFRRARIDGVSQREIAKEFGISLSTVESDLRDAARALMKLKGQL